MGAKQADSDRWFLRPALVAAIGAIAVAIAIFLNFVQSPDVDKADGRPPPQSGPSAIDPASKPTLAEIGVLPGFDVVRINPSGDAVIAGRAEPGATVTLRDGRSVLGQVIADGRGEWVFVPEKPLQPGAHRLDLEMRMGDGATTRSTQEVLIVVPEFRRGCRRGFGLGRLTTARSPRSSRGRADDCIAKTGNRCW